MIAPPLDKHWWTATELAKAHLPDLPKSQKGIENNAKREGWRDHPEFSRKRSGQGGGWEYNWQLLPLRARRVLLRDATPSTDRVAPSTLEQVEAHAYFETLTEKAKSKARNRLRIVQAVLEQERTGLTKRLAVDAMAQLERISSRSIWNWFGMVETVPPSDWLPYLAPRHKLATRRNKKTTCNPEFMDRLKADYLRLERPSFASCYRRVVRLAREHDWDTLPERTALRRLNEEVPRVTQIFAREGYVGLERCFPPQTRDRTGMVAMEGVNADCHKFDVFVQWPDQNRPERPQIVAFQDIYSGKILSWRVDHAPNKVAVMSAFRDMIETYGIPRRCLFDNVLCAE